MFLMYLHSVYVRVEHIGFQKLTLKYVGKFLKTVKS